MRVMFGGGDVKLSMIKTLDKQREILLTAGDGAVVEKLDLTELAREGAPPCNFCSRPFSARARSRGLQIGAVRRLDDELGARALSCIAPSASRIYRARPFCAFPAAR